MHVTRQSRQRDGLKCNTPIWLKSENYVVQVNTTNASLSSLSMVKVCQNILGQTHFSDNLFLQSEWQWNLRPCGGPQIF